MIGGFEKQQGSGTLALGFSYEATDRYLAGSGGELTLPRTVLGTGLYGNYAWLGKLNTVVSIPVLNGQFQDAAVFSRVQIVKKSFYEILSSRLFAAVGYSFPLSNYETEIQQAIGQQAKKLKGLLVNQWDLGKHYFLQVQSGVTYVKATDILTIPLVIKAGWYSASYYLDIWYDAQTTDDGKDYRGQGNLKAESLRELGVSYRKIGGSIYKGFKNGWGLSASFAYIFAGRNIGIGPQSGVGLVYNFKKEKRKVGPGTPVF